MKINLLPEGILRQREARQRFELVLTSVILIFALFAVTYLALSWRLYNEGKILAQLEGDNIKLKKTLNEYKEFVKWRDELKERKTIAANAMTGETRWSFVLDEISMVIPNDVWLKEFQGDSTTGIIARGYTFNHPAVAKWMVRQADIKKLTDIDLRISELTEIAKTKVISFETSAQLVVAETKTATAQAEVKTTSEPGQEEPKQP